MEDLTLDDCRPEVQAFALLMERELRANDHKPGWKGDYPRALFDRLQEEVLELDLEIRPIPYFGTQLGEGVVKEAVDVANFAMMIADVCGGSEPVPRETKPKWDPRLGPANPPKPPGHLPMA